MFAQLKHVVVVVGCVFFLSFLCTLQHFHESFTGISEFLMRNVIKLLWFAWADKRSHLVLSFCVIINLNDIIWELSMLMWCVRCKCDTWQLQLRCAIQFFMIKRQTNAIVHFLITHFTIDIWSHGMIFPNAITHEGETLLFELKRSCLRNYRWFSGTRNGRLFC